jgi:hypothetical protein
MAAHAWRRFGPGAVRCLGPGRGGNNPLVPQAARAARDERGRCGSSEVEDGGHGRGGCCLPELGQAEQLLGGS